MAEASAAPIQYTLRRASAIPTPRHLPRATRSPPETPPTFQCACSSLSFLLEEHDKAVLSKCKGLVRSALRLVTQNPLHDMQLLIQVELLQA